MNCISHGDKPPPVANRFVLQDANADGPCDDKAQEQISSEARSRKSLCGRGKRSKDCPDKAMRKNQSKIGSRTAKANSTRPTQLVIPETAKRLCRIHR